MMLSGMLSGMLSSGCAMFIPDRTIENVMNQVGMQIQFVGLKPELNPAVLLGGKAGAMNFDVEVTLTNKNNVDLVLHGTAFRAYLNDKVVVEGFQKFAAGDKVRPRAWHEADAAAAQPDSQQTAHARR